jgi:arylsulfatase A-like enzyme
MSANHYLKNKNNNILSIRIKIILILLSLTGMSSCWNVGRQKTHPNVLLIITDDQGWGDLSIHGNQVLSTPVLDQLAGESVRFDRFYVCPVCAPTRASLLTGRYHLRTGTSWVTHRKEVMKSEEYTLAESFHDNGYKTACIGKWHNGEQYPNDPLGQGFDEFFGFKAGHWNNYFNTHLIHNNDIVNTEGYITDVLTNQAISFIKSNINNSFFCYLAYNAPHGPFQVPDKYFEKYKSLGMDDRISAIYGMCENIDDNVGRLLSVLDSLKITENTIVLFLTDNGPNGVRYNGSMKGIKGNVDEGGIRVPLFIRYPGKLPAGKVIPQICAHIDLFPTLHKLCKISWPDTLELDGINLLPFIHEDSSAQSSERMIFTHQVNRTFRKYPGSVRTREYRMVINPHQDTLLYNMISDPGQTADISADYPFITSELVKAYDRWLSDVISNGIEPPPIPVGYEQAPLTCLPAPEAKLSGNLHFKGGAGWANDWITGFTSPNDSCYWEIDVNTPGEYKMYGRFAISNQFVPVKIQISNNLSTTVKEIYKEYQAPLIESPDRVKRGEVYERIWERVEMGTLKLPEGKQYIGIRLSEIKEACNIEWKALYLEMIQK